MELVRGGPATGYCDQQRLTPRRRPERLVPVCRAGRHTYAKGVIHRDLKPGDALVTLHDGVPVPRVIDFAPALRIERDSIRSPTHEEEAE